MQSPLPGHKLPSLPESVSVDQLEMDRIDQGVLVYCPLLDQPASYVPDVVDLTQDTEARYAIYEMADFTAIHPIVVVFFFKAILARMFRRVSGQVRISSHQEST